MADKMRIFNEEVGQESFNIAKRNFYLIDQFFLGNHKEDIPTLNDVRDYFYRCLRELNTAFRCGIVENCSFLPKQDLDVVRFDYNQLRGLYYLLREHFFPFDDSGDDGTERELKNTGQNIPHPIGIHSIDNYLFFTDVEPKTHIERTRVFRPEPNLFFPWKRDYSKVD